MHRGRGRGSGVHQLLLKTNNQALRLKNEGGMT
jgi:hypothetical protein